MKWVFVVGGRATPPTHDKGKGQKAGEINRISFWPEGQVEIYSSGQYRTLQFADARWENILYAEGRFMIRRHYQ
jgi:hypothetical protein